MRGATDCARRLKKLFASLRSKLGKVNRPATGDPISQLILGIFSRDLPEAKAREALDKLREMVVDYNELRVVAPTELAESLADIPDVRLKTEDLSRALNRIFAQEHLVSLDRLSELSAKDARAYLDEIDGLDPYSRARIRLLGLGQHAVPLDEAMWAYAQRAEIVAANCPLDEAQRFLERQVAEPDALEFFTLLRKQAWTEMGTAVRKGSVDRILSVPPDRTSRNMLQLVSAGAAGATSDLDGEEAADVEALDAPEAGPETNAGETPPRKRGRAGKPRKPKSRDSAPPDAPKPKAPKKSARRVKPADKPPGTKESSGRAKGRKKAKTGKRAGKAAKARMA